MLGGLLAWALSPGVARAGLSLGGRCTVVVVMKRADCPVCLAEIAALQAQQATLDARLVAVTHEGPDQARIAAARSGIEVIPDRGWIERHGLFEPAWGHPRPAVVLFDRCGREAGRILGRGPGRVAAPAVVALRARIVEAPCGGPAQS